MALASPRHRQRRRRWLVIGVMGTVVVLAVNAAMSARSPAPARQLAGQSYLDQVLPAVERSTQQGLDVDAVRTQATQLGGAAITRRLGVVANDAHQASLAVRRVGAPSSLRTAADLLIATMAIRDTAAQALRDAMAQALSGQPAAGPIQALVDVGLDLQAADRTYQLFVQAIPPLGVPIPPSKWVGDANAWTAPLLASFLTTLHSNASLAPVHDVAVLLVTTDPQPVNTEGANQVLPSSKLLNMQIVVGDQGNQPEKNLTVTATITPAQFGPSEMVRDFVNLTPGQRRTVQLGGLHPVVGQVTTLVVRIDAAPGETNTADNTKTLTFIMH
jgi:hypothetical protein